MCSLSCPSDCYHCRPQPSLSCNSNGLLSDHRHPHPPMGHRHLPHAVPPPARPPPVPPRTQMSPVPDEGGTVNAPPTPLPLLNRRHLLQAVLTPLGLLLYLRPMPPALKSLPSVFRPATLSPRPATCPRLPTLLHPPQPRPPLPDPDHPLASLPTPRSKSTGFTLPETVELELRLPS